MAVGPAHFDRLPVTNFLSTNIFGYKTSYFWPRYIDPERKTDELVHVRGPVTNNLLGTVTLYQLLCALNSELEPMTSSWD